MKRITVEKCLEKFEVTDGDYAVFVVNKEGVWGIENGYGGEEFIFTGYSRPGDTKTAKAVVRLLKKAIEFIEERQKEEK